MPTVAELGARFKQKYPGAYDNVPDADVGRRVQQKYPGAYDNFTATAPEQSNVGKFLTTLGQGNLATIGRTILDVPRALLGDDEASDRVTGFVKSAAQGIVHEPGRIFDELAAAKHAKTDDEAWQHLTRAIPLIGPQGERIQGQINRGEFAEASANMVDLLGQFGGPELVARYAPTVVRATVRGAQSAIDNPVVQASSAGAGALVRSTPRMVMAAAPDVAKGLGKAAIGYAAGELAGRHTAGALGEVIGAQIGVTPGLLQAGRGIWKGGNVGWDAAVQAYNDARAARATAAAVPPPTVVAPPGSAMSNVQAGVAARSAAQAQAAAAQGASPAGQAAAAAGVSPTTVASTATTPPAGFGGTTGTAAPGGFGGTSATTAPAGFSTGLSTPPPAGAPPGAGAAATTAPLTLEEMVQQTAQKRAAAQAAAGQPAQTSTLADMAGSQSEPAAAAASEPAAATTEAPAGAQTATLADLAADQPATEAAAAWEPLPFKESQGVDGVTWIASEPIEDGGSYRAEVTPDQHKSDWTWAYRESDELGRPTHEVRGRAATRDQAMAEANKHAAEQFGVDLQAAPAKSTGGTLADMASDEATEIVARKKAAAEAKIAASRAKAADNIAKHLHENGFTLDAIDAQPSEVQDAFWKNAGGAHRKGYKPSADTIDAVRERLATMERAKTARGATDAPAATGDTPASPDTIAQVARDLKKAGITPGVAATYDASVLKDIGVQPFQHKQLLRAMMANDAPPAAAARAAGQ